MQKPKFSLLAILALVSTGSALHAQTPAADFNAASFNATNDTLTDSVSGIVAVATNNTTANNPNTTANTQNSDGSVTTTGAGFTFNADAVPGLLGLTSYTLAVGFTYNTGGGAPGGANAYNGQGAFGGDLPGAGDGDANIAVTSDSNGQIVASLGSTNGGDNSVYDTVASNGGNFVIGSFNRAVLVVSGNTETLYANGAATTQRSPLTLSTGVTFTPFGYLANGTVTSTYAFGIGTNTNGTTGIMPLNGSIDDVQIYESALTAAQAEGLTLGVAPEPSTWALLLSGLGALTAFGKFRRKTV